MDSVREFEQSPQQGSINRVRVTSTKDVGTVIPSLLQLPRELLKSEIVGRHLRDWPVARQCLWSVSKVIQTNAFENEKPPPEAIYGFFKPERFNGRLISHKGKLPQQAAREGNTGLLRILKANGREFDKNTSACAAEYGRLGTLKWLRTVGCPWDEKTCVMSAMNGHLKLFKYAHQNGCPWGASTANAVELGGYPGIIKYARDNKCPCIYFFSLIHARN